jgi:L-cystine uptake protein TcyP (sodium:dicarboxylate symporter family)
VTAAPGTTGVDGPRHFAQLIMTARLLLVLVLRSISLSVEMVVVEMGRLAKGVRSGIAVRLMDGVALPTITA